MAPVVEALAPKQVRERFFPGRSHWWFRQQEKQGAFESCLLDRPMGRCKYSSVLFEKLLSGESVARFGRGKFTLRRPA